MSVPAELRTERLLLRQWRQEDVEPLAAIYTQPAFLEHMPARDLGQTRAQIERFARAWQEDGFSLWAVEEPESGTLIGRAGLIRWHDWPLWEGPVEVGWALDPAHWGRGFATEAGRASLECWREHLADESRVISITTPANARSRRVMEKLGLTYRGTAFWHGHDVVWYAVDRT